ncbi:MAG TPA: hypothetical protein PKK60_02850 [archaeon]|nr:hypothetical protein [archaeon]
MVDFKINHGPWQQIFIGKVYGHEVEIITNQEHIYLIFIYELIGEKKIGAIVEGYKALYSKGQIESFINTLPKPSMGIMKNNLEKTQKIFFLTFDPIYLDFTQEDYLKKLDYEIDKNFDNIRTVIDLARTSSIELKELGEVSIKEYFQIIGDPFVMQVLLSPKRTSGLTKMNIKMDLEEDKQTKIQLGLTKNREIVIEKTKNLYRTSIVGEKQEQALYCAYILAENLLLEGKQVIIFDQTEYFNGLAEASKNDSKLKEQLVEYEPSGFPVKKIVAKENMKVSMKNTELGLIFDNLGIKDEKLEEGIIELAKKINFNTPQELIANLFDANQLNDFQKLKAERILTIIDNNYGKIFGKNIELQELIKKWPGTLGRATIIETNKLNKNEDLIFTQSLMNYLEASIEEEKVSEIALIITNGNELFKGKDTIRLINELEKDGFGIIFTGNSTIPESIESTLTTKINVIKENDIAITVKGKPSYRLNLRPNLSGNPKY